jgi:hypothetical protein
MAMQCTICSHPEQGEIDRQLLAGTSLRKIAQQFAAGATALHRHKKHIAKVLVAAREAEVTVRADTLLDQVRNLLSQAERLTLRAEQAGSLDTALRGIGAVRGVLELLGQVSGQLSGKGVNIAIGINGGAQAVPNFKQLSNDELQQILKRNGQPVPLLEGPTILEGKSQR